LLFHHILPEKKLAKKKAPIPHREKIPAEMDAVVRSQTAFGLLYLDYYLGLPAIGLDQKYGNRFQSIGLTPTLTQAPCQPLKIENNRFIRNGF